MLRFEYKKLDSPNDTLKFIWVDLLDIKTWKELIYFANSVIKQLVNLRKNNKLFRKDFFIDVISDSGMDCYPVEDLFDYSANNKKEQKGVYPISDFVKVLQQKSTGSLPIHGEKEETRIHIYAFRYPIHIYLPVRGCNYCQVSLGFKYKDPDYLEKRITFVKLIKNAYSDYKKEKEQRDVN